MNHKVYKFKAFISYQNLDATFAKKLQKKIENYKLPKPYREKVKWKVFRDETDLPTCEDITEEIMKALNESEFLILILSPEFKKSKWCMKEVRYFKHLHHGSTKKIIPVIVRGKHEDVFFSELYESVDKIMKEDGNIFYQPKKVEPLAAYFVSKNRWKKSIIFKKGFLRVAAELAYCGYDDLYARHERRQNRNFRIIIIGLVFVVLVVVLVSINIYIKNLTIIRQNAVMATENALFKLEMGEYKEAVATAIQVPYYENNVSLLPNTERFLTKALGLYSVNDLPQLGHKLKTDYSIVDIAFSPNGKFVLAWDQKNNTGLLGIPATYVGHLYVWDVQTGKNIYKGGNNVDEAYFCDNESLIMKDGDIIRRINFKSTDILWEIGRSRDADYKIIYEKNGKKIIMFDYDTCILQDNNVIKKIDLINNTEIWNLDKFFSNNVKNMQYTMSEGDDLICIYEKKQGQLCVIDCNNGNILCKLLTDKDSSVHKIWQLDENHILILLDTNSKKRKSKLYIYDLNQKMHNVLICDDAYISDVDILADKIVINKYPNPFIPIAGKGIINVYDFNGRDITKYTLKKAKEFYTKFEYEYQNATETYPLPKSNYSYILQGGYLHGRIQSYNLAVKNNLTGEIVYKQSYKEQIKNVEYFNGLLYVYLSDGTVLKVNMKSNIKVAEETYSLQGTKYRKIISANRSILAGFKEYDHYIDIYKPLKDEDSIWNLNIMNAYFNKKGNLMYCRNSASICIYDDGIKIRDIHLDDDEPVSCEFLDDQYFILVYRQYLYCINLKTKSKNAIIRLDEDEFYALYAKISEDEKSIIINMENDSSIKKYTRVYLDESEFKMEDIQCKNTDVSKKQDISYINASGTKLFSLKFESNENIESTLTTPVMQYGDTEIELKELGKIMYSDYWYINVAFNEKYYIINYNGILYIFNQEKNTFERTIEVGEELNGAISIIPNSNHLIACSGMLAEIYDLDTGLLLSQIRLSDNINEIIDIENIPNYYRKVDHIEYNTDENELIFVLSDQTALIVDKKSNEVSSVVYNFLKYDVVNKQYIISEKNDSFSSQNVTAFHKYSEKEILDLAYKYIQY